VGGATCAGGSLAAPFSRTLTCWVLPMLLVVVVMLLLLLLLLLSGGMVQLN